MSWVPLVTVEEATSETKNIYDFLQNNWGFVPNYYQALGPYPQLLKDQVDMFTHVMFVERSLTRETKEQIALVVSGINLSNYCMAAPTVSQPPSASSQTFDRMATSPKNTQ